MSLRRSRWAWAFTALVLALIAVSYLPGRPSVPWQTSTPKPDHLLGPTDNSAVPSDALIVATDGDDANPGTVARPLRSIGAAVRRASEGQTIAVREGVWYESVHIRHTQGIHLRSWPGERVWLDGTRQLQGFTTAGGAWRLDGYDIDLDTSPTFSRGAPDNTRPGWGFINAKYPFASDPSQIWLDETPLRQVAPANHLPRGTFAVDRTRRLLLLGSDPTGHQVRAGVRPKALTIDAPGTTISGLGIRRYVPSLPDFGAFSIAAPGAQVRDVIVTDSATIGVSVQASMVSLHRVEITRAGMLGLHVNRADDVRLVDLKVTDNNTERFNMAPTAGGAKITTSRRLHVEGGDYSANWGTGLWLDESVVDSSIIRVDADNNASNGIHLELSTGIDAFAVRARNNGRDGICVQNTDRVRVWHLTAVGNHNRGVNFLQDERRPTDPDADGRLLDGVAGTPSWRIGDSEVVNSVLAAGDAPAQALVAVEDLSRLLDANSVNVRLRSNIYVISTDAGPRWSHVWSRPDTDPRVFTSPSEFAAATGADTRSRSIDRLDSQQARDHIAQQPVEILPADLAGGGLNAPTTVGAHR